MKKLRYRLRRKFQFDTPWVPIAWTTNSKLEAQTEANRISDDDTLQVYDCVAKRALEPQS